jgi:hypothetical protein
MKKNLISAVIVLFLLAGMSTFASDENTKSAPTAKAAIAGVVSDKSSNEKLAGVMIQLVDSDMKVYSNAKGEFNLDGIEPGTYQVRVNCISYRDKTFTVKVPKGKKEKLSVQLNPIEP